MSDSTYYGPANESSLTILWEKMWLISGYLAGVGFGMLVLTLIALLYSYKIF